MATSISPGTKFNFEATKFLVVGELNDAIIRAALARYNRYWHSETVTTFIRPDHSNSLPLLFRRTMSDTLGDFLFVKRQSIITGLGLCSNATPMEVTEAVLASGKAEDLVSKILSPDIHTALAALTASGRTYIPYCDLNTVYGGMVSEFGELGPSRFLDLLTDFEEVQSRGLKLRHTYPLLVALYSEGAILHPFGLWRGLYPASGHGTPQAYMFDVMNEFLLSAPQHRDFRVLEAAVGPLKSKAPGVLRLLQCLSLAKNERLIDFPPGHILRCVNAYLAHDGFRSRRWEVKKDSRPIAAAAMKMLSNYLVDAGVSEAIKLTYPKALIDGFAARNQHGTKGDGTFPHLSMIGLNTWVTLFNEYLEIVPVSRKKSALGPLLAFTDWLAEHGQDIGEPEGLSRSDVIRVPATKRSTTLNEYLTTRYGLLSSGSSRAFSQARLFLEWYQRNKNELYRVPLLLADQPRLPDYDGKTSKEALPARIIEMMKEVLCENDWAWPKQFASDTVTRQNAVTGLVEETWCPVRAKALYIMLWIPIRAIQIRLLDSGEFDEFVLDSVSMRFTHNPRGQRGRRIGVFREFNDTRNQAKQTFIGMYINTNKTQRIYGLRKRQGYEIKWQKEEIQKALLDVRDWQMVFNPIAAPIHVNDLQDSSLHAPDASAPFIPPYSFLFRDPASTRTSSFEPISYTRLNVLFLELCAETERRLKAAGVPVQLIDEWETRADGSLAPKSSIVTLHSLRVSGITNFAEFGVPLNIITEFLSGHASILMNVWYQKFGFATVSSVINKASTGAFTSEGMKQLRTWVDERAENVAAMSANAAEAEEHPDDNANIFSVGGVFASGSPDAIESLRSQAQGLWHLDIDGICPNGRTLCHEGGPRIGTKGWTRSTPVPGGNGNCPRCRYWVTGPMFIFGQIVKANVLLYHIKELGDARSKLQDELDDLQMIAESKREIERRITEIRASLEVYDTQIENALYTWTKRYEYAVQSVSLLRANGAPSDVHHQLLTTTDNSALASVSAEVAEDLGSADSEASRLENAEVQITLAEAHPLDLLEFVAQACEVIPGIDVSSARLRKSKLLDMMLDRESKSPLFFKLSDDDALRAGNALTRFMANIVDQKGVTRLLAGECKLADLGLSDVFDRGLAAALTGISTVPANSGNFLVHEEPPS